MHVHIPGESHAHAHSHSHAHVDAEMGAGFLTAALVATFVLLTAEFAGGYFGHSIALISNGIHNLSDVPTILISWIATLLAKRPADTRRTFGYQRAGILAAFTNAILLVFVASALFWEAALRLQHPVQVSEQLMIWLSVLALLVNGGITVALVRGRSDLNLRTLYIHNLGDALSNVAVLVGALVIRATGAVWLDPVMGLAIGILVFWSSIQILRESGHILLEGTPHEIRLPEVANAILQIPGVQEVHDIHVWTLGTNHHALSCHVRIPDMHMDQSEQILTHIRQRIAEDFQIRHTTIQFERAGLPESGYYMPEPFRSTRS